MDKIVQLGVVNDESEGECYSVGVYRNGKFQFHFATMLTLEGMSMALKDAEDFFAGIGVTTRIINV